MARVDLPQSKLRLRKRRRRVRIAVLLGALVLIVCIAVVAFFHAPFLRVTGVAVSGTQTVATSSVADMAEQEMQGSYFYLFPKDDIFLYPQKAIAAAITAKYPMFKSVDVHAQDFHTVAVSVVERKPAALWCTDASSSDCYLMDEGGVVYAPTAAYSGSPYVVYIGVLTGATQPQQYLTVDDFHSLTALVQALSQVSGTTTVESVSVDSSGDVDATFTDGFDLKFLLSDASGDVFERFTLALKSDPFVGRSLSDFEYLDLRFGDKLYYMLKTQ